MADGSATKQNAALVGGAELSVGSLIVRKFLVAGARFELATFGL
jgi:hypothetical protein